MATDKKVKRPKNDKKKGGGIGGWFRRYRWFFFIAGGVALILCGLVLIYALKPYTGDAAWVYIPRDADTETVRDSLQHSLGDGIGERVYSLWRLQGGNPSRSHGAYLIKKGEWAVKIARDIKRGLQTPVKLSWSDARTMEQLARKVTKTIECTPEEFLAACHDVLPGQGFTPEQFPAAFIPDSYEMYWSTSPHKVVSKLLNYRNKFWTDERVANAAELGLKPVDVATLASIVEEESAKSDERPKIARLYINRLQRKMLLQADPTVKFAVGNFGLRRILNEHLSVESPYNTYKHIGLPPGPIRIPSRSGLEAVLAAPGHDYLYMCAKEDFSGYHNFARDYATHLSNARRYQQELNRRNIH
ncbi:MAG: endolytic transglycosylase MltG [Paramuribaculum sp.]|nr:endolytic transglycosylase MltG [Paramuribaculum sp.]